MDLLKGEKIDVKDPKLQPSIYNIGQLYLSGEENTLLTLTPSCEKVCFIAQCLNAEPLSCLELEPVQYWVCGKFCIISLFPIFITQFAFAEFQCVAMVGNVCFSD